MPPSNEGIDRRRIALVDGCMESVATSSAHFPSTFSNEEVCVSTNLVGSAQSAYPDCEEVECQYRPLDPSSKSATMVYSNKEGTRYVETRADVGW